MSDLRWAVNNHVLSLLCLSRAANTDPLHLQKMEKEFVRVFYSPEKRLNPTPTLKPEKINKREPLSLSRARASLYRAPSLSLAPHSLHCLSSVSVCDFTGCDNKSCLLVLACFMFPNYIIVYRFLFGQFSVLLFNNFIVIALLSPSWTTWNSALVLEEPALCTFPCLKVFSAAT
jgi:hypothetical protein